MSNAVDYATGCYSINPVFAWWNYNPVRLASHKEHLEKERISKKEKQQEKKNSAKIAEGTISIYA